MTLIESIKKAKKILIVGHMRPDGDCLGAGFAVMRVCKKYSKDVDFLCDSPNPNHYSFMPEYDLLNVKNHSEYDLLIALDCADSQRLGKYSGYLGKIDSINIDHHITNNRYASTNYIDTQASSTCEIIFGLLDDENEMDEKIACYLFIGLSTDTGHFMHSNTNSKTFETAAKLLKYNINVTEITNNIYKSNTIGKTKLIARAINSMRFFNNDEICIISIFIKDLEQTGCVLADTEGLIDHAMHIASTKVAVCLTEQTRPQFKVSYRSKQLDVAAAAAVFGGGGHKLASGCVVGGQYEDVICKIVKSITDGMDY